MLFEIGAVDFREIAAIERIDAGFDLGPERLKSQAVFSPTLLKYAQRVADRLHSDIHRLRRLS